MSPHELLVARISATVTALDTLDASLGSEMVTFTKEDRSSTLRAPKDLSSLVRRVAHHLRRMPDYSILFGVDPDWVEQRATESEALDLAIDAADRLLVRLKDARARRRADAWDACLTVYSMAQASGRRNASMNAFVTAVSPAFSGGRHKKADEAAAAEKEPKEAKEAKEEVEAKPTKKESDT